MKLTAAQTSLFLALIACRELDTRHGISVMTGHRRLEDLGWVVRAMPGSGNKLLSGTVGGYKRDISRRIRRALRKLSKKTGCKLWAPCPIVHTGYGSGYGLLEPGIELVGLDVRELVRAVEVLGPHGF